MSFKSDNDLLFLSVKIKIVAINNICVNVLL